MVTSRQVAAGHGRVAAENCSAYSDRLAEPLAGTAPLARSWLLIEQPGPWGARALTESHLDPELGAALNARAEGTGVRLGLIRRVGHHALTHEPGQAASQAARPASAPRRALLATTRPGSATVRMLTLDDPRELLGLDFARIGAAGLEALGDLGAAHPDPVLLVCTNGKRDRCCALLGRSLAHDLTGLADSAETGDSAADSALAESPDSSALSDITGPVTSSAPNTAPSSHAHLELWETDHLGGHRFAPTALVLPTGYAYGRLDAAVARAAVAAAARGEVDTDRCRGRSTWSRPGQAAELALRGEIQEFRADAVEVLDETRLAPDQAGSARTSEAKLWAVDLAVDQDRYSAVVEETAAEEPRPESCGKAFGTPAELRVVNLRKID